ncbi:hypothetical protein B0E44_00150, partial [Flavobacterium sp. A45]
MKKNSLKIIIIPFLLFICQYTYSVNDLEKMKLKGNVKSIREYTSERFGSLKGYKIKEKICEKELQFNIYGSITRELQYLPKCDPFREVLYSYNDKNLIINEQVYYSKKFHSKRIYEYDNTGKLFIEYEYDNNEKIHGKLTFENDEIGRIHKIKSYLEPENSLWITTTKKYDLVGNLIERLSIKYDSSFYSKT